MKKRNIGFCITGSFCTFAEILEQLKTLTQKYNITPIVSEHSVNIDTRFGAGANFLDALSDICQNKPIQTIVSAEPIGPQSLFDALVIAPITGNTLGKLANGITDNTVSMAAKAHLRNEKPVILGISTNDGLLSNAENIGKLLGRKYYYFVPFGQDDPLKKPYSLVADYSQIGDTIEAALGFKQLQPLLLRRV